MNPVASWMRAGDATFRIVPEFELRPERTALIVIDLQYIQTHRDYGHGPVFREYYPEVFANYYDRIDSTVIPAVQRLLWTCRNVQCKVLYLRVGALNEQGDDLHFLRQPRDLSTHDGGTGPRQWRMALPGSKEHQIRDEVAPAEAELVIDKNTASGFTASPLDQVLRNWGIEDLVLAGTATSACVLSTAVDAADRGYKCILVEDACATPEPTVELHDASLRIFHKAFGRVSTAEDVCKELGMKVAQQRPTENERAVRHGQSGSM